VYAELNERDKSLKTKEEMLNFAMKNFAALKVSIQESVAAGFQGAVSTFSGQQVDYYCQVKPIPEPINKRMI